MTSTMPVLYLAQLIVVCTSFRETEFRKTISDAGLNHVSQSVDNSSISVLNSEYHGHVIGSQADQKQDRFAFLAIPVVVKGVPLVIHWASAHAIPAAWHVALGTFEFCKTMWIKTIAVDAVVDTTTCAEALYSNATNTSNSGEAAHAAEQLGAAYEIADTLYTLSQHGLTYTVIEYACAEGLRGLTKLLGREKVIERYCGKDREEGQDPLPEVVGSSESAGPDWQWCPNLHGVASPDADSIEKAVGHYKGTHWHWRIFGGADVQMATDMICHWAMQEAYKGKMDLSCPNGEAVPYQEWHRWFAFDDDRRQPICEWLQE